MGRVPEGYEAPLNQPIKGDTMTIKIATFNTWKNEGDYLRRLDLIAAGLRGEGLDVLCCQESFRTADGEYDTASNLAGKLGMNFTFSAARKKNRKFQGKKTDSFSGLAILTGSRAWVLSSGSFLLPGNYHDNGRVAQYAVIRKNGSTILIFNLHLSHLKNGRDLRRRQLQSVMLHPILNQQHDVILICGDFNAGPEAEELNILKKGPTFRSKDAFTAGGGNPAAFTLAHENGSLNDQAFQRVDHIFVLENKNNTHTKLDIENSRILLNQPDKDGTLGSDHFGVALDLKVSHRKIEGTERVYRYNAHSKPWRKMRERELDFMNI